eukprot:TRINITY_DN6329_c0_g1_i2.p1 TRINITY_DN6329_c0_g1~~TRINITY_DN6329_c0_g1_i2.p1  ORF type:complete len:675 (+),score=158.83 TRINITY_DN6329_c0_g1_i2:11-2035(+)
MSGVQLLPKSIFQKLPKAELHCHLDGGVRVSTIIELAKEQNVELPTFDETELSKLVTVDETCESLEQYLVGFDLTLKVLQKSNAITRAMFEVAEDAVKDGIRYLEVRFSPILHTREGLSLSGVMEAVVEGRSMAEYSMPISISIIVCGMRQLPSDVTRDLAEIAWRYRHKGVSGFDLAGPESGFSSKHHRKAFGMIRRKGINCTLHSGEAAGWQSVQDSIQFCGAHRLGHGVHLQDNEELLQFVVNQGIAVECCLTSNIHTKAIKKYEEHPIKKYFNAGVKVVPCTDNPTVSGVTLSGEYAIIQEKFGFSIEEMVRMIDYGFNVGFMEVTIKQRMRAQVLRDCVKILKDEGYDIQPILNNSEYYDFIGADLSGVPRLPAPSTINSNFTYTKELCKLLPKTDLHVTLDGSFDYDFLYHHLNNEHKKKHLKNSLHIEFNTKEDLIKILQQDKHNQESLQLSKRILKQVMQSKHQLEAVLDIIYNNAISENVRYMEVSFRPSTHTLEKLTEEDVVNIVTEKVKELNTKHTGKTRANLIIYASTVADDPIKFLDAAKLAVKYKNKGVCAFGVFGADEFNESTIKFFESTFYYLKANNLPVTMVAGITSTSSLVAAIDKGGARRLSAAFTLHNYPRLMNYLANHSIPVELSLSNKMKLYTKACLTESKTTTTTILFSLW